MNITQAKKIVERALENPAATWPGYTPKHVPLALYDGGDFAFIQHPNPPAARPDNLSAATAVEINGVLTAVIPTALCDHEEALVSLVYHECFHVYQGTRFTFKGSHNFFEVLAYYPELNPAYRALCSAETDVCNSGSLTAREKAGLLAITAGKRREVLAGQAGLVDFEDDLERNEGTAYYVEQRARTLLFGSQPEALTCSYKYSRQYEMGAATCRLLEALNPAGGWQEDVERGMPLFELLARSAAGGEDLSVLGLEEREEREKMEVERILAGANRKIERLVQNGAITIKLPNQGGVFKSFSPGSIVSLGDGRLIHPEFVSIQTSNGTISVENAMTLEDIVHNTVTIAGEPVDLKSNRLEIETDTVNVSLENIRRRRDGVIELASTTVKLK